MTGFLPEKQAPYLPGKRVPSVDWRRAKIEAATGQLIERIVQAEDQLRAIEEDVMQALPPVRG